MGGLVLLWPILPYKKAVCPRPLHFEISSRRCVVLGKIRHRGLQGKPLVRTPVVVVSLEPLQFPIDRVPGRCAIVGGEHLAPHRAIDPLDTAVVLGRAGRQHRQGEVGIATRLLKAAHEFTAAIHLDRAHRIRRITLQVPQEVGCRLGGLVAIPPTLGVVVKPGFNSEVQQLVSTREYLTRGAQVKATTAARC